MRLEIIDSLRILIVAFLSYIPTVAFAGWFESWVAKKMGDTIPEEAGFLTFNPFQHFSIFGFGALLVGMLFGKQLGLSGLPGWGRHVPIAPGALMGPTSKYRAVIEFLARSFGHFILTIVSFLLMVKFLSVTTIYTGNPTVVSQGTAFIEVLRSLFFFFFHQNSVLFIIYFIVGSFHSIIYFMFPDMQIFSAENMMWTILILLGVIFLGSPILEVLLYKFLMLIESLLVAA